MERKQSLRPSTRLSYRTHIRLYLVPHLGDIALVELRPDHLEAMYLSLANDPDLTHRVSPSTMTRVHATLMSALGTAVRRGLIDRNPAETVELPTPNRPELMVWTADELAEFLGGIVDDDLYPLFVLLALCDSGEARPWGWGGATSTSSTVIRVRQQLIAVGRHIVVGEPKSRAGNRQVALDITTVRLLHCHRTAQQRQQDRLGPAWVETGLVFTEPDGAALRPDLRVPTFRPDGGPVGGFSPHQRQRRLSRWQFTKIRYTYASRSAAALTLLHDA